MPSTVTAYGVKIDAPGEAPPELFIAREVIADWNAHCALEQKRVLLPLDARLCQDSEVDLLIAFFSDVPGLGDDPATSAAEIERHLGAGRPALIYVSETRVDLVGPHVLDSRALEEYRTTHPAATVDSYGDEKEFRSRLARHLDAIVNGHPHFQPAAPDSSVCSRASEPAKALSPGAQTILCEACDDFEGYIGHLKVGNSLRIQANGRQLVEDNKPETIARWESAFHELLEGGYIRDAGCNGQLFQISTKGFEFLKTVGKTPVGYIAELGGM